MSGNTNVSILFEVHLRFVRGKRKERKLTGVSKTSKTDRFASFNLSSENLYLIQFAFLEKAKTDRIGHLSLRKAQIPGRNATGGETDPLEASVDASASSRLNLGVAELAKSSESSAKMPKVSRAC